MLFSFLMHFPKSNVDGGSYFFRLVVTYMHYDFRFLFLLHSSFFVQKTHSIMTERPTNHSSKPRRELCIICGEKRKEPLKSPWRSTGADKTSVIDIYDRFLTNYRKLLDHGVGSVLAKISPETTALDLYDQGAAWHKICKNRYASDKVERTIQRRKREAEQKLKPTPPLKQIEVKVEKKDVVPTLTCSELTAALLNREVSTTDCSLCLLCQKDLSKREKTSCVTSQNCFDRMLSSAEELKYFHLMARLAESGWMEGNLRYHLTCYSRLTNERRRMKRKENAPEVSLTELYDEAFQSLFQAMRQSRDKGDSEFLLNELWSYLMGKREQLGLESMVNRTRLKERILEEFGEQIVEEKHGKQIILYFKE